MEKLAAIIPRPAVTLLLYHGVLAPSYGRPGPNGIALEIEASPHTASPRRPAPPPHLPPAS